MLTQAELKQVLDYNPETGAFTWLVSRARSVKVGQTAGSLDDRGYLRIQIQGKSYSAHRLAFLWMTGVWPENEVDHINGVRGDNRWVNLRNATHAENAHNIGGPKRNGNSGYLGVSWDDWSKSWLARIRFNGKQHNLGRFPTPEAAHAAYMAAKEKRHPTHQRLRNRPTTGE